MEILSKKILVTGGTGFLGEYLVKRLVQQNYSVNVLGRTRSTLEQLQSKYPSIHIFVGDLTDKTLLVESTKNVTGIFHLAAFKHVRQAEEIPLECIESNIVGTMHLLEISSEVPTLKFILGISTDKACQVNGVYGASKFLMEKVFLAYEKKFPQIQYRLVRLGNILYSTGSVLCKWKDLLSKGEAIIITDENITRFYWTPEKAIDLLFECLENAPNAKPYIPPVKAMKLKDILDVMIAKYHPKDKEPQIQRIGIQNGENFHEKLEEHGKYSNEVPLYTKEEIWNMI